MKNISFFLKLISFFILIFIWIFTILNYKNLPEIIPVHFGGDGKADGFGSKNSIWMLPILATMIFLLFYYLSRNPDSQLLNLPKNVKTNPIVSRLIVQILSLTIISLVATINYGSILTAMNEAGGLNILLMYTLLFVILGTIVGSLIYSWFVSRSEKASQ